MHPNPFHLLPAPWGDLKLITDRDAIIVLDDRKQVHLKELSSPLVADVAYIGGVSDKSFGTLCKLVHAKRMDFFEMRVADLSPLASVPNLRDLAIRWNTKLTNAAPLAQLDLTGLILEDTPKLDDIEPIGRLRALKYLEFSGGNGSGNTAKSLEPLAQLPALRELRLLNLKVKTGGLAPLARCKALAHLEVSNQFPTEDYAFLSVRLPDTKCTLFKPWVKQRTHDEDIMIVGSRKPFLNSATDGPRIEEYERAFVALQKQFASNKALQPDAAASRLRG